MKKILILAFFSFFLVSCLGETEDVTIVTPVTNDSNQENTINIEENFGEDVAGNDEIVSQDENIPTGATGPRTRLR